MGRLRGGGVATSSAKPCSDSRVENLGRLARRVAPPIDVRRSARARRREGRGGGGLMVSEAEWENIALEALAEHGWEPLHRNPDRARGRRRTNVLGRHRPARSADPGYAEAKPARARRVSRAGASRDPRPDLAGRDRRELPHPRDPHQRLPRHLATSTATASNRTRPSASSVTSSRTTSS